MLIVTRRTDESVIIEAPDGSEIVITPCKCRTGRVKLGIVAPQEYVIRRDNMIQELQNEEAKG